MHPDVCIDIITEVSNQMLELYEQNRLAPPPQSNGSEADVSDGGANNNPRSFGKTSVTEEQPTSSVSGFSSQVIVSKPSGSSTARQSIESDSQRNSVQNPADGMNDHKEWDDANKGNHHLEKLVENGEMNEGRTPLEGKEEKAHEGFFNGGNGLKASTNGSSDVIKRIDKEKVKAALEKRRKSRAEDLGKKPDAMDDYDIIERELENGVEMAERERKQKKSIASSKAHSVPANRVEADHNHAEVSERSVDRGEGLGREALDTNDNAEEEELSSLDGPAHPPREHPSPMSNSRKRKAELSPFNRDVRPDYYHDREHNHRNYRQEPSHV